MSHGGPAPESLHPVPDDVLAELERVRAHAHAPYSRFQVAALIETEDGRRHVGCNVESSHYKSLCAEAAALAAMVSAGQRRFVRVWILTDEPDCPPCGDCRQRLYEFGGPDAQVMLVDAARRIARCWSVAQLLPTAFTFQPPD
ncbi:MAG: cytidine deaminase [Wenzhouxiangellaceae bacterium]